VSTLRNYGEQIGVAFQLSDDIIDIASDSDASGKTPGTDLREGVATLPVLYAMRRDDAVGERLRALVDGDMHDAAVTEALRLLRTSPAMEQARATTRGYADAARAELADLPDVAARQALEALCDLVTERTG
jgi:heptaprenyl diphosphate synthase